MFLKLFNKIYINPNEVKYIVPRDGIFEIAFKDGTKKIIKIDYPRSSQIVEVDSAMKWLIKAQAGGET